MFIFKIPSIIYLLKLILIGQIINVGSKINNVGGSYSNPFVSTIPINSTDLIVVVSGSFAAGSIDLRWYWYRNEPNSDFKTIKTSLVANQTFNYSMTSDVTVVRTTKNSIYGILVYISDQIDGQEINLASPAINNGKFAISPPKDYDRSLTALSHTNTSTFSAVFGARNSTHTCIFRSVFSETLGSPPQTLYCPGTIGLTNNTYSQAWIDPNDDDVFYVTSAFPSNTFYTHKCKGIYSAGLNQITCAPVTQVKLSQAITQSYGKLVPNSNIFFYVGTSDGNPVQVIAVDFVANVSTTVSIPLSIAGTRTIALVDSVTQNAATMLVYDASIPGFQVFDLVWNTTIRNITYNAVANFTSANMFTISGTDIPAASLSRSIFTIATASTDTASQVSTQFFGRQYCGDGLVFSGEECDSVQYCNATCQCTYGAISLNTCNPPYVPTTPPVGSSPTPISVTPAQQGNGTGVVGTPDGSSTEAGVKIEVIVPAVIVPVVVVVVGVVVLVVLLKRRNKKKKPLSENSSASSSSDEKSPQTVKLEPVLVSYNYFVLAVILTIARYSTSECLQQRHQS